MGNKKPLAVNQGLETFDDMAEVFALPSPHLQERRLHGDVAGDGVGEEMRVFCSGTGQELVEVFWDLRVGQELKTI